MTTRDDEHLPQSVFEASPGPIFVHDPETGEITRANAAAGALLGVDPDALVGTRVGEFSPVGFSTAEANELIATARATGDAETEWRVEGPDGEPRWMYVKLSRASIDGELRVVAFAREVTERRERERRRKERNEQLRTLVDNLPVVVFTLDTDGVFTHSAGRGLETLGLEPDDLAGESVFDAYADYPDITDAAETALDGEEVRAIQELDGLTFETWYQPVYDETGSLTNVVGVARDLTDMKRRERRIERLNDATQELLYAESSDEIADLVTEIARDIVGRPIAAMWTYDEDRLTPAGATAEAETVAASGDGHLGPIERGTDEMAVFEAGEPSCVRDYRTLDAPSHPTAPLRSLLCLPLGEYGLLCVGSDEVEPFDDSEQDVLELLASTATAALDGAERARELREYREELERSNRNLQQFAYVASHDLQEPLRMVSSYVDLLDAEYGDELDDEAREYMDFAVDGARRMQDMVDALLTLSRVQTEAKEFEASDANEVVEDTLTVLRMHIDDVDATVTVGDLPPVEADPDQLGQVFQNLVKNAVTYAGDGETAPVVEIDAERDGAMVTFSVRDNGPGVPETVKEDIFEVFTRGGTHDDEGTGIGLAVCERIVNRHGGDIWVESEPGEGATFRFTVPAVTEGEARV